MESDYQHQYTLLQRVALPVLQQMMQIYSRYDGAKYTKPIKENELFLPLLVRLYQEWYQGLLKDGQYSATLLSNVVWMTRTILTEWNQIRWEEFLFASSARDVRQWHRQQVDAAIRLYTDGYLQLKDKVMLQPDNEQSKEYWSQLFFERVKYSCDQLSKYALFEKENDIQVLLSTLDMAKESTVLQNFIAKKTKEFTLENPDNSAFTYSSKALIRSDKDITSANLRFFFDTTIEQQNLAFLQVLHEKNQMEEQQKTMEVRAAWMQEYLHRKADALRDFVRHFKQYIELDKSVDVSIGSIPFASFIETDQVKYFIDHILFFFLKSVSHQTNLDLEIHIDVMKLLYNLGGRYAQTPFYLDKEIDQIENTVIRELEALRSNPTNIMNRVEYGLQLDQYLKDHWAKIEDNSFIQTLLSFDMKFELPANSRKKHTYIIGKTGSGKTELLKQMIYKDIQDGKSVFVLDPHGDLANECRRFDLFADETIRKRLIYLSPEFLTQGYIPAYNPFDWQAPGGNILQQRNSLSVRAQELANSFQSMFQSEFTHNMRTMITNCITLLLEQSNTTLADLVRLLYPDGAGAEPYEAFLSNHWNTMLRDYFLNVFPTKRLDTAKLAIITRFETALSNQFIRNMFLSPKSSFQIASALDDGAIIIVNAKESALSTSGTSILGALLTAELNLFATQRANKPKEERHPVYAYIDECQKFLNDHIDTMLAEARKYGVHLILSHQFLGQFEEMRRVKQSIMANTAIKFCGRVSAQDQTQMSKETQYAFTSDTVLGPGQFICRIDPQPGLVIQVNDALLPPIEQNNHYVSVPTMREWMTEQWERYYNQYDTNTGALLGHRVDGGKQRTVDPDDFIPEIDDI